MDPATIALLQSFGYDIAKGLIASAIVEGKKLKDDRQAHEMSVWLSEFEHAKALDERIGQKIYRAFQNINLGKKEFELLIPLASDVVLITELVRQLVEDRYTSDSVANLILETQPLLNPHKGEIQRLASLLIEAIQSAIADDPHLHRMKELQFQARTTLGQLQTQQALSEMSGQLNVLIARMPTLSAPAENLVEDNHLKTILQKRFDSAREELLHGSVVIIVMMLPCVHLRLLSIKYQLFAHRHFSGRQERKEF